MDLDRPSMAHRLRCVMIKAGVVNTCPDCGMRYVTDFVWDFALDPAPEAGPIPISGDDGTEDEFVEILREIAPSVAMPCGCQSDT